MEPQPARVPLGTIARTFLRLGLIGFGGPSAHIALMQDELVVKRGWISEQRFLDALGVTNLVPGPNSSEMAIHIGFLVAGRGGALIAGVCFALPSVVMMTVLSIVYFAIGGFAVTQDLFAGLQPVVIAVIVATTWRLRSAVRRPLTATIGIAALGLTLWLPRWGAVWILGGGFVTLLAWAWRRRGEQGGSAEVALLAAAPFVLAGAFGLSELPALAWVFLKTGALLFGGGYVLIPLLEPQVLARGWLTHAQFIDGIALGQATPGPIVTTSAFVGYAVAGIPGALVATVAVYLPAFVIVMAGTGPFLRSFQDHAAVKAAASGFNAAAIGAIGAAAISLGKVALSSPFRIAVGVVALVLLMRRAPVWAVLLGGLAAGLVAAAVR